MTALWLLIPILFGLVFTEVRNRRYLRRLVPAYTHHNSSKLRLLPDLLAFVALALIIFALQPPDHATTIDSASGPAIALVVDVSISMQVTDRQPTRLTRAKQELLTIIDNIPGARFSLIPFAGEAVLQVPLTRDRDGLKFFINNLHTGLIDSPGSAPEEAVQLAQNSLSHVEGERLVVLLSDGERTIAEQPPILSDTIPVYGVLIGTADGGQVGKVQNAISKAEPERLVAISNQTGGRLLKEKLLTPAVIDLPLVKLATETSDFPPTRRVIFIALFLLLLRWTPAIVPTTRIFSFSLLLLVLFLPGCDNESQTTEPRASFNSGRLAAQNKDTEGALEAFSAAAENLDGVQRGTSLYNQATLLLETGKNHDAIILFEQALILMPGDASVRDNLLLALDQQTTFSSDGHDKAKHEETSEGEEMSPQQAQRLIDSVQLDPAAPLTESTVRHPTVLKEW